MRRPRYTLPALADLEAILDYIVVRSPQGARRVQHPFIGTRTNDPAIRRMTTAPYPYLIFYETTDAEVIIHAVRHVARDPAGMPGAS